MAGKIEIMEHKKAQSTLGSICILNLKQLFLNCGLEFLGRSV